MGSRFAGSLGARETAGPAVNERSAQDVAKGPKKNNSETKMKQTVLPSIVGISCLDTQADTAADIHTGLTRMLFLYQPSLSLGKVQASPSRSFLRAHILPCEHSDSWGSFKHLDSTKLSGSTDAYDTLQ